MYFILSYYIQEHFIYLLWGEISGWCPPQTFSFVKYPRPLRVKESLFTIVFFFLTSYNEIIFVMILTNISKCHVERVPQWLVPLWKSATMKIPQLLSWMRWDPRYISFYLYILLSINNKTVEVISFTELRFVSGRDPNQTHILSWKWILEGNIYGFWEHFFVVFRMTKVEFYNRTQ